MMTGLHNVDTMLVVVTSFVLTRLASVGCLEKSERRNERKNCFKNCLCIFSSSNEMVSFAFPSKPFFRCKPKLCFAFIILIVLGLLMLAIGYQYLHQRGKQSFYFYPDFEFSEPLNHVRGVPIRTARVAVTKKQPVLRNSKILTTTKDNFKDVGIVPLLKAPEYPPDVDKRKKKLIYFGTYFFGEQFQFKDLPPYCETTYDPKDEAKADAVIYHLLGAPNNMSKLTNFQSI